MDEQLREFEGGSCSYDYITQQGYGGGGQCRIKLSLQAEQSKQDDVFACNNRCSRGFHPIRKGDGVPRCDAVH